jgi:hypothetical protein
MPLFIVSGVDYVEAYVAVGIASTTVAGTRRSSRTR